MKRSVCHRDLEALGAAASGEICKEAAAHEQKMLAVKYGCQ